MNQKYLYLLLDVGSFIVPFLFSFYKKANFSKQWKFVMSGIVITGIIFLIWDEMFTRLGIWGFNRQYTTGIFFLHLPLEEVLFFLCIPYACYFTYFAFSYFITRDVLAPYASVITKVLLGLSITFALIFVTRWYTVTTFSLLALLLFYRLKTNRISTLGRFYFTYAVLLIPFFIVNGILTGSWIDEPVVWYNNAETMGIRLGTIPLEDSFYAMLMVLLAITIGETLEGIKKNSPISKAIL